MERQIARWRGPTSISQWRNNVETMKEFARNRPEIVLEQLRELETSLPFVTVFDTFIKKTDICQFFCNK